MVLHWSYGIIRHWSYRIISIHFFVWSISQHNDHIIQIHSTKYCIIAYNIIRLIKITGEMFLQKHVVQEIKFPLTKSCLERIWSGVNSYFRLSTCHWVTCLFTSCKQPLSCQSNWTFMEKEIIHWSSWILWLPLLLCWAFELLSSHASSSSLTFMCYVCIRLRSCAYMFMQVAFKGMSTQSTIHHHIQRGQL